MAKPSTHNPPCSDLQETSKDMVAIQEQLKTLFRNQAETKIQNAVILENTQKLLLNTEKVSQLEKGHKECRETAKDLLESNQLLEQRIGKLEGNVTAEQSVKAGFDVWWNRMTGLAMIVLVLLQVIPLWR